MRSAKIILAVILTAVLLAPLQASALGSVCDKPTDFHEPSVSKYIKVPCFFFNSGGPAGAKTAFGLILIIMQIALLLVAAIAILFLIYGGYRYVTSFGNEEAAESAKRIIRHAILGILIVILSFAVITLLANLVIAGKTIGP